MAGPSILRAKTTSGRKRPREAGGGWRQGVRPWLSSVVVLGGENEKHQSMWLRSFVVGSGVLWCCSSKM